MSKKHREQHADTIGERAQKYLKENDNLLRRHGLILKLVVTFPKRRKVPLLSRWALKIINRQGGQLDIEFNEGRK
jgi:hypothetical protein